jgi:hypothetical protein
MIDATGVAYVSAFGECPLMTIARRPVSSASPGLEHLRLLVDKDSIARPAASLRPLTSASLKALSRASCKELRTRHPPALPFPKESLQSDAK